MFINEIILELVGTLIQNTLQHTYTRNDYFQMHNATFQSNEHCRITWRYRFIILYNVLNKTRLFKMHKITFLTESSDSCSMFINSQLIEVNGHGVRETSKMGAKIPRFMLESPRLYTIFYLCYLNSFPNKSKQLRCVLCTVKAKISNKNIEQRTLLYL